MLPVRQPPTYQPIRHRHRHLHPTSVCRLCCLVTSPQANPIRYDRLEQLLFCGRLALLRSTSHTRQFRLVHRPPAAGLPPSLTAHLPPQDHLPVDEQASRHARTQASTPRSALFAATRTLPLTLQRSRSRSGSFSASAGPVVAGLACAVIRPPTTLSCYPSLWWCIGCLARTAIPLASARPCKFRSYHILFRRSFKDRCTARVARYFSFQFARCSSARLPASSSGSCQLISSPTTPPKAARPLLHHASQFQ